MRASHRRYLNLALLVVVAGAPLLASVSGAAASTTVRKIALGVTAPGIPWDVTELNRFETDAGRKANVVSVYTSWHDEFTASLLDPIVSRGALPMVTWEPWDPANGTTNQPAHRLATITAGAWDAYIVRWATGLRDWGQPILLRFAHEMNGNWYPWSERVNGNAAGQFVAAWKHVRSVFRSVGASNVTWVWSPNVVDPTTTPLAQVFPGTDEVDWLGVDGFNGGTALPWGGWKDFNALFVPTLGELRELARKPILIAEVASAEAGGSKSTWINGFFAGLRSNPDIVGFVWFNWNKETDWRIQSSEQARRSFNHNVARLR